MVGGAFPRLLVENDALQKLNAFLTNRKLPERKQVDIQNHTRGAHRAYGLLVVAVRRPQ
jgi:transposase